MVLQVHDELVFDAVKEEVEIQRARSDRRYSRYNQSLFCC
jgi:DNA polymerase I-like protein with 3'-5' exonuclease and polymerase domains